MKRVFVDSDSFMSRLSTAIADISDVMTEYFETYYDMSRDEAEEYFEVYVEDEPNVNSSSGVAKRVTVRAEVGYEDFNYVSSKLNQAVQAVDKNSYFDAVDAGKYVAVVSNISDSGSQDDPIFSQSVAADVADKVAKQISSDVDEKFDVTECYVSVPEDEDDVNVYVAIESDSSESLAVVSFDKNDVVSVQQFKMDLTEELYTKLVNSIVPKEG